MSEEIKEVIDHVMEEHPVKLTSAKIKWLIVTGIAAVGVIYTGGIKTQSFLSNIKISEINVAHQQEKAKMINEKLVLEREKAEALADADFYKSRYLVSQKRLTACLDDKDFINSSSEDKEELK